MQMQHFHFSRFHPRDKRGTSVSFMKRMRRARARACLCTSVYICLFVKFEMRGDRRETGGEVV